MLAPDGRSYVPDDPGRQNGEGETFRGGSVTEEIKPRTLAAECAAEFAGTMILILFGVGVVAQVVVGEGALGDHDSIAWAWGLGVTFGV